MEVHSYGESGNPAACIRASAAGSVFRRLAVCALSKSRSRRHRSNIDLDRLTPRPADPYGFCLESPPSIDTWGTPADVAAVTGMYANVSAWYAARRGKYNGILMGEAGCHVEARSRAGRLQWYATVAAAARASLGGSFALWDDNGSWKIYDRNARTWDEDVMTALGLNTTAAAPAAGANGAAAAAA